MPELPEVEIVCRNLSEMIKPREKILDWIFFRADLRFKIPKKQLQSLINQPLINIQRRAKYILFNFQEDVVISHLGMTGSWRMEAQNWPKKKHDHLAFEISKKRFLVYQDPRRFGFIEVIKRSKISERFVALGAEPLDKATDFKLLTEAFKKLNAPIKNALMNQKLLVGVGNIYASEALFRAGVNPLSKCSKITQKEYVKIWKEVAVILNDAISKGGSTIENYRNSFGEKGDFQNSFFVYGRAGEECLKCHTLITSRMLAGRNTFWCPSCQKK